MNYCLPEMADCKYSEAVLQAFEHVAMNLDESCAALLYLAEMSVELKIEDDSELPAQRDVVDLALSSFAFVLESTFHSAIGKSPDVTPDLNQFDIRSLKYLKMSYKSK